MRHRMLTYKRFLRYIRKHENVLDPVYQLTMDESRKMLSKDNYMPFHVMIQTAQRKSRASAEDWVCTEKAVALSKAAERNASRFAIGRVFYARKRLSISLLAFILLTGFLTLTPIGRSMAKEIFDYIITIYRNIVIYDVPGKNRIILPGDTEPSAQFDDDSILVIPTPKEYRYIIDKDANKKYNQASGEFAVILRNKDFLLLESQTVETPKAINLFSTYKYTNGSTLTIRQSWFFSNQPDGLIAGANVVELMEFMILDGARFDCIYDVSDDTFGGNAIVGTSRFTINAGTGIPIDEVLSHLEYYSEE